MSDDRKVRVLIVDDSAIMRQLLADILRSSPHIEVAGYARNGLEAMEKTRDLRPDVITLDVEMPVMSGLEALPGLVGIYHKPVVMVSSLTQEGAETTLTALEMGAVDFVPKPVANQISSMRSVADEIVAKILQAGKSQVQISSAVSKPVPAHPQVSEKKAPEAFLSQVAEAPAKPPRESSKSEKPPKNIVLIGISTGGPQALSETIPLIRPPVPPILIVQHMPSKFTGAFADRLNRKSSLEVREAVTGDRLKNDTVLIAPGGKHLRIAGKSPLTARIEVTDDPPISGHKPSVDCLFESALPVFGESITAIIMTGMGRDGVRGLLAIRAAGGATFGQDEATSTVYGMNKAAWLEGAVETQFPLTKLPGIVAKSWRG
ncbi:chemotaxis-specific protein-glutamate methyltransferase CheB [bacterium]|nr:chemotaxis-specific protein-glutamate methyltransferase CheB [bacterium]